MTTSTYEQTPPRRPTIIDVGGAAYENDAEFPPDTNDPDADDANQMALLIAAAHRVLPHTMIVVQVNASTPAITGVFSMRSGLLAADFALNDAGAGIIEITHTEGLLPAESWPAESYVTGNAGGGVSDVEKITNGWRVRTRVGTTLTDNLGFVLKVSGL